MCCVKRAKLKSLRPKVNDSHVGQEKPTTRSKVQVEAATLKFHSTTTDMWSSRTTGPYLNLTVHFTDNDF